MFANKPSAKKVPPRRVCQPGRLAIGYQPRILRSARAWAQLKSTSAPVVSRSLASLESENDFHHPIQIDDR